MLSYMKCGKTECEKPRLLESAFCEEHQARAETPTRQWYEYVGKDGRSHWRVTGGNCGCGWTIINDFEWNQHLNREGAERKGQAERAETPAPREPFNPRADAQEIVKWQQVNPNKDWVTVIACGLEKAYQRGRAGEPEQAK